MKNIVIILLIILSSVNINAQIDFEEHILYDEISSYAYQPDSRFGDIDNDGDIDVFFATGVELFWCENTNGLGSFAAPVVIFDFDIYSTPDRAIGEDIDNDGDLDLIVSYWLQVGAGTSRIKWLENDGLGNFSEKSDLPFQSIYGPAYMITSDLNGDDFNDVILFFFNENVIKWASNSGSGNFNGPFTITADGTTELLSFDVDNDGDLDIIRNKWWLENIDGLGGFGNSQNLIPEEEGVIAEMHFADIDLDDYQDIIASQYNSNTITWFKNTDGFGNFIVGNIISINLDPNWNVHGADIDGDGDIDVISTSENENKIVWFENLDGLGSFGESQLISTIEEPLEIQSDDIDGDGDIDLLITSESKISYFENLRILNVDENDLIYFSIYPNPTSSNVHIQSKLNIVQIKVINNLGQVVLSNINKKSIDLSSISQGLYFIKITDENGNLDFKKILKK
jgi:hypothetical protein